MPYWELERHPDNAIALIDSMRSWNYAELAALADDWADLIPAGGRSLGFLGFTNSAEAVALYLGALRSGSHVPLLLQADIDALLLEKLVDHYVPEWNALASGVASPQRYDLQLTRNGLALYVSRTMPHVPPLHDRLALLLSTSGSTGSSKLVRLSYSGIADNARSISKYLGLLPDDRAITTLPMAYSFGMSILNSHLEVGASIVLTDESLVGRRFWEISAESGITSLSGVPATFEMLRKVGLERFGLGNLRMLTQAGGRLRDALIESFLDLSERMGLDFFVMYGQTEAAPRISYVPPSRLREKIGSIGIAVPGGSLSIDDDSAELIYRGPNVMLGYAESRDDLALGDEIGGVLRTGDLARCDEDGFHYLMGRVKRFIKVSGNRVNLDEVESMLSGELRCPLACSGSDDNLVVFLPDDVKADAGAIRQLIQQRYKLFPGYVRISKLAKLPVMSTGKVDYRTLRTMSEGRDPA